MPLQIRDFSNLLEQKTGREFSLPDLLIYGANDRIRTGDLLITSELLYQLSHVGLAAPYQARKEV
jgi:hypothetical protein